MQQSFRFAALFLAVFFLLARPGDEAWGASQIQSRYAAAAREFAELENGADRASRRDAWEALATRFGKLRAEAGTSLDGAKAAFMEARSYGMLALRSRSGEDFTRAERAYGRFAEEYASTGLAPEALHRRALILSTHLGNTDEAVRVLDVLRARYPEYGRLAEASALRVKLAGEPAAKPVARTAASAASPVAAKGGQNPGDAGSLYDAAAREWRALLRDKPRAAEREPWLALEGRFLDVLGKNPGGETGGKARFQAARCREELASRTRAKSDWQAAVEHYLALARDFPKSSLADDGLFRAAVITEKRLNDPGSARRLAARVLDEYPRGDMVRNARGLLASLSAAASGQDSQDARQAGTAASRTASNAASAMQALPGRAGTLTNITSRGTARRTVVTLELDGAATFRHQYLAAGNGQPPRIQIDIDGVGAAKGVNAIINQNKRPVRRIRVQPLASRENPGTRVTLELAAVRQYAVDTSVSPPGITVQASLGTDLAGGSTPPEGGGNGPLVQGRFSGVSAARPGTLLEQLGLAVRTIMIDAGHGGKDPGAMHSGVRESDITLTLAKLLGDRLAKQGFSVLYTRTRDVYVSLDQRPVIANEKKADLFISLHVNASKDRAVNGLETYFLDLARSSSAATVAARENAVSVKSISDLQFILTDLMLTSKLQESHDLASLLHKQMFGRVRQAGFTVSDNGVRSAPFYVLMGARMPAALVEIGYLTNDADAKRILSAKYLERLADGLTLGVVAYKKKLNRFNR